MIELAAGVTLSVPDSPVLSTKQTDVQLGKALPEDHKVSCSLHSVTSIGYLLLRTTCRRGWGTFSAYWGDQVQYQDRQDRRALCDP